MMLMSAAAAVINFICLKLLQRLEKPDVALRAATTFSFNDFISNGGILVAGGLVLWLGSNWPDLIVGVMTALIAMLQQTSLKGINLRQPQRSPW